MKKIMLVLSVFLFGACAHSNYKTIKAEEALSMMSDEVIILDVREVDEYDDGHISKAINLPLGHINKAEESFKDKEQTILVYCRSGRRSAEAAKKLVKLGYTNVYDFGGILDWPYEIVKD